MSTSDDSAPIGAERLRRIMRPIGEATGLPNVAYTSEAYHRHERDTLLAHTWVGIAFTDAIPEHTVAQPIEFMGWPLLVVRDRHGELRVFHNVCSHRGMQLVGETAEIGGLIVCRYHSWSYATNGDLKATPHIGGVDQHHCDGFDRSKHGLKAVRSALFMGILFVNLSGDAPDFDRHVAELKRRAEGLIGADGWARLRPGIGDSRLTLTVRCNWKLAVENYCEAYHLPWVHPELNAYSTLADHYCFLGEEFAGQGSHTYRGSEVAGTHLPHLEAWPAERMHVAEYPTLYPNVLIGFHADHAFAILLTPEAFDRTREELRIFYVGAGGNDETYRACRAATLSAWRIVFQQDVPAVERLQIGRASPGYDGGVFSPAMDAATHHFHGWVARGLAEPRRRAADGSARLVQRID
ncbi:MAG TPA: aromatic ring-hydroxylating dioxygenase subunit alpha [Steroidobacteraceae bacterium]|nr:aromatic ring-hydroxylating dioxygenase subunit alpha [Steroidobacteraceae bacterium]